MLPLAAHPATTMEIKKEEDIMGTTNQKKARRIIGMLLAAMGLSGCASNNISDSGNQLSVTDKTKLQAEATAFKETILNEKEMLTQEKEFSKGINKFTYDIFSELNDGKNVLISPYSITTAFSMLANGAEGETKQEIMNLFGIQDLDKWNAYTKDYIKRYQKEDTKLLTANSVWLSDQLTLSQNADQEFFASLSNYYHVDKKIMDLSTETAKNKINKWVSKNTNGMINPFLERKLEGHVRMVLLNAVYFAGDWEEEFKKEDTQILDFNGANGKTQVDMMCKYGKEFKYVEKNGLQGIELPYVGNKIAMNIIKKTKHSNRQQIHEPRSTRDVFEALSAKEKNEFFKAFDETEKKEISTLMIPKFTISYSHEKLKDILVQMGLTTACGMNAEFDKIAEDIFVDRVTHKTKIEVEEKGTKAAAVTSIMMRSNGVMINEGVEFIVDEPFIVTIRDVMTGTILFIGDIEEL